jgi:hypothetical protein
MEPEKPRLEYQTPARLNRVDTVLVWSGVMALVIGAAGFGIGFFGPMILYPQSNQGPLVGIFMTGPLGVVVGALLGAVIGLMKGRRR